MTVPRFTRKLRRVPVHNDGVRYDLTLPREVIEAANLKPGMSVEIHATPSRRIVLHPLRADWTPVCGSGGCLRARDHSGDHITEDDLPF